VAIAPSRTALSHLARSCLRNQQNGRAHQHHHATEQREAVHVIGMKRPRPLRGWMKRSEASV